MDTIFKFWVTGYNNRIGENYEGKILLSVFAKNEADAIKRASSVVERKLFEVTEVSELINDSK